jgi:tRNA (guanine-N7-)-methyltransferase
MLPPLSQQIVRHLVPWKERAWPLDWAEVFGRSAPLALEIGFGNGAFLEREARAHPERDHVGIELSWIAATHLFRRLERAELANVRVLLGDAELLLGVAFRTGELAEVFLNHPCPWPKARHQRRRLFDPGFVARLADRMAIGARLTLVTDHAEFADWARASLESQSALASCHPTSEVDAIPGREPTKYEQKARARGERIRYFEWRKRAEPATPPALVHHEPVDTMLSVNLRGAYAEDRLFAGFDEHSSKETERGVQVVVRLRAVYRRSDGASWLVETLVVEDGLQQELGLLVLARPGGLRIQLAELGRPHPTYGVRRSLALLADWLRARHPELELEHHNLGQRAARG